MQKSETIAELAKAMNKAQAVMGHAHKSSDNPFFKSKYADLAEVLDTMRKPFSDNGLAIIQMPFNENGLVGVETLITHESGEWVSNCTAVQPNKTDAQGMGSVITYLRRYSAAAFAGIAQADDDGNAGQHEKPIEPQQAVAPKLSKADAAKIRKNLKDSNIDEEEFERIGGCKVEDIAPSDVSSVMQWIYDNAKDKAA